MAIAARLSLHIMYEFTAFMNMWAVEVVKVSGGVAAQVTALLCSVVLCCAVLCLQYCTVLGLHNAGFVRMHVQILQLPLLGLK